MNLNMFGVIFIIFAIIFGADADEHNHVVSKPSIDSPGFTHQQNIHVPVF